MPKNTSRRLSRQELSAIPETIAAGINTASIRIHNRRWTFLTPARITVARGYNIFWPGAPQEAQTVPAAAHLVHEVVHVWQYKALGVGLYSPRWLDRRYGYDLQTGDQFLTFGLEQQASIVEDYYLTRRGYPCKHARNSPSLDVYNAVMLTIPAAG